MQSSGASDNLFGRVASVAVTIDGVYTTSTTFDAAGRVETINSPNGFSVRNVYSPVGYLAEVRQNGAAGPVPGGAPLWRLVDADAQGRARNEVNVARCVATFPSALPNRFGFVRQ